MYFFNSKFLAIYFILVILKIKSKIMLLVCICQTGSTQQQWIYMYKIN